MTRNDRVERMLERYGWAPHVRRDRTTGYRPPWERLTEKERAFVLEVSGLPEPIFRLLEELCLELEWSAERALPVVLRAARPAATQRRRTTRNARRFVGRALGRRIQWGQLEAAR